MCEHCQNTITANTKRVRQFDPTFTTSIRNAFVREMNKRFNYLIKLIKEAVVDQDVFGLGEIPTMKTVIINATGLSNRQYAYKTSSEKIDEFMQWLEHQQELHILQLITLQQFGRAIQEQWTNLFIADSYKRGIQRGRQELSKAGAKVISIEQSGGIMASMNSPFHADRVGVLYSRVFTDLQGITSQMDTLISRVLSQGIIDGDNPRKLARKLLTVIDGRDLDLVDSLGRFIPAKRRAEILARTEVIRAHHAATIQEFENYGAAGVEVIAEFITAGDNKVCEKCKALEGKLFSIEIARNLIPVHPQCFIDWQVPIYTSEGWKAIGEVEIGNLVLTHKGRFRKVYALPRQTNKKPTVVKIYFANNRHITVTKNHPVLKTNKNANIGKWIDADDVKIGDNLMYLANECKHCNKAIPYHTGQFNFMGRKVTKIMKYKLNRGKTLYNLSVEDDESYIANGVVVHNCRCVVIPKLTEALTPEQKDNMISTVDQLNEIL